MAFRPLTEAECGQANPLSKLTSHVTHDHTFTDNHGQLLPNSSDQLVEQFLQESRAVPQTFRMDDLMREMHEIESQRSAVPPIPSSTIREHLHNDAWAQQYIDDGKQFSANNESVWAEIISQEQSQHNFEALADKWSTEMLSSRAGPSVDVKTTEELYSEATGDDSSKYVYSKFMKFMKEEGNVEVEEGKLTETEAVAWTNEYFRTEGKGTTQTLADNWAEEHLRSKEEEFNTSFWNQLQEEFKKMNDPAGDNDWIDDFNSYYNTAQKEYQFSEENPMLNVNEPLERGKKFLEEGDFPSAVLCFEAAVKKEPENAEAWLLLGTTQAENEQDPMAIPALNRCLQLDSSSTTALMALAVSYTNESYYNQACQMLLKWLQNNPKYSSMVPENLRLSGQVTSLVVA